MLERSAVVVTREVIEVRFTVALPARGRSVLGQWAATILSETLPGVTPRPKQSGPLAAPQLAPRASSARAWRLWGSSALPGQRPNP